MPKGNSEFNVEGKIYRKGKLCGEGGNGKVYQAKGEDGKQYAVKVLKIEGMRHGALRRFKREIKFCTEDVSPHVIKVIGKCVDEGVGHITYVMPFYEHTLRDEINKQALEAKTNNNTEPPYDGATNNRIHFILRLVLQLCEAVLAIHKKGVVHRDIKPENILIDNNGCLVLTDFGIAHFVGSAVTKKSDLLANRSYLAPEQMKGGDARNVTASADVFAVGRIVNECMTGTNPVGTSYADIITKFPSLWELDALVRQMLNHEPASRPEISYVLDRIRLINQRLLDEYDCIKDGLMEQGVDSFDVQELGEDSFQRFREQAIMDLITAGGIMNSEMTYSSIARTYNHNYHDNIHYHASDELFNICVQELIYRKCLDKFMYETGPYRADDQAAYHSQCLDLENPEHKALYGRFNKLLEKCYVKGFEYAFSGRSRKLFMSCADYHCKEILRDLEGNRNGSSSSSDFKLLIYYLKDAPIMFIVEYLFEHLKEHERLWYECFTSHDSRLSNWVVIDWGLSTYNPCDHYDGLQYQASNRPEET